MCFQQTRLVSNIMKSEFLPSMAAPIQELGTLTLTWVGARAGVLDGDTLWTLRSIESKMERSDATGSSVPNSLPGLSKTVFFQQSLWYSWYLVFFAKSFDSSLAGVSMLASPTYPRLMRFDHEDGWTPMVCSEMGRRRGGQILAMHFGRIVGTWVIYRLWWCTYWCLAGNV